MTVVNVHTLALIVALHHVETLQLKIKYDLKKGDMHMMFHAKNYLVQNKCKSIMTNSYIFKQVHQR